jgi:hypothetical protein
MIDTTATVACRKQQRSLRHNEQVAQWINDGILLGGGTVAADVASSCTSKLHLSQPLLVDAYDAGALLVFSPAFGTSSLHVEHASTVVTERCVFARSIGCYCFLQASLCGYSLP